MISQGIRAVDMVSDWLHVIVNLGQLMSFFYPSEKIELSCNTSKSCSETLEKQKKVV